MSSRMILAIESSCDETGAAVAELNGNKVEIKANIKASSAEITSKYGGIVPEVVAREQVAAIIPTLTEALEMTKTGWDQIEGVAVSYGPGLVGSLLIGVETAKTLAFAQKKKLIKVDHVSAHLLANWIVGSKNQEVPPFPAIGLVVSGKHTEIFEMKNLSDWGLLGATRDDAAGEAFDKAARALGLPYPGGPMIQELASRIQEGTKVPQWLRLPRPMINEDNLEMSFSGLKTALAQVASENKERLTDGNQLNLLAYEFNQAVVEVLVTKTRKAIEATNPKSLILAGGVAANLELRRHLALLAERSGIPFFCPAFDYCTDNAAMIAAAGLLRSELAGYDLRPISGLAIEKSVI